MFPRRPYPRCIFCGDRANSSEHAIPKWIGKRFDIRKEELQIVVAEGAAPRRRQPVIFGSHREHIFCKPCNAHFKHLEDEAIPVIEWMARRRPITLSNDNQDLLARWGAKTGWALLAAATHDLDIDALVPQEQRYSFRATGIVSPCVWVGYGSWRGSIHRLVSADILESRSQRDVPRSYLVALTFAGLALQVFGVNELLPGLSLGLDRVSLKQVFPRTNRDLSWPPPRELTDSSLRAFMDELPYKLA